MHNGYWIAHGNWDCHRRARADGTAHIYQYNAITRAVRCPWPPRLSAVRVPPREGGEGGGLFPSRPTCYIHYHPFKPIKTKPSLQQPVTARAVRRALRWLRCNLLNGSRLFCQPNEKCRCLHEPPKWRSPYIHIHSLPPLQTKLSTPATRVVPR